MVKIQIIEKLFSYLLIYSFLIIPFCFLFSKSKQKALPIVLLLYGVFFFIFLNFFYDFPLGWRKAQQTVYTAFEYFCFAFIIYSNISIRKIKQLIVLISFLFLSFQIIYYFLSPFQYIDSVPVGIETIIIIVFIIIYFYQFFKFSVSPIYNDPAFYLIIGILIYLGGTFFFNILGNEMSKDQWNDYWHLTYIPEILKNILFGFALLIFHKSIHSKQNKQKTIPFLDMDIA